MSIGYWLQGDTRVILAELADAGVVVDLVVTSPPFLGLRSYLPADDPAKALEMGSEPNPGGFIDGLLDVTEGCERLLAPHGSLCVELGDKYAGSGGAGGDYAADGLRANQPRFGKVCGDGWPADKSLALTAELYRVALAYGFNPLTGRTTPRWRVRNVVTWVRTNPAPGRDGDKFRTATSDIAVACRTDKAGQGRYWDGDAVRVPASVNTNARLPKGVARRYNTAAKAGVADHRDSLAVLEDSGTAPLLDWWNVSDGGYPDAHYATFPAALVEPLVKAMCPQRVCTVCGQPSRRIVKSAGTGQNTLKSRGNVEHLQVDGVVSTDVPDYAERETVGWTDCGHDAWRPGIVLDPFAGSGTTLAVATGHGRDAIGIDLDSRNVDLARQRVGGLLFNETTVADLAEALAAHEQGEAA